MITVIGLDPGICTGICVYDSHDWHLIQCGHASARGLLIALLEYRPPGYAQIEKFVTGNRAGSKGTEADIVRALIPELRGVLAHYGYKTALRPAADVKPWASDKRLEKAGVPLMKTKLRDATDAARHALYCAVKDAGMRDPLA